MNSFYYGLSLLNTLYGIEMNEDTYEETALVGWELIGNKRSKLYRYSVCVDDCSEGVELPCNCDILEAVTTDFEEWNYSTNTTPNGDINSAFVESYIEHRKAFKNPLYISGKLIPYERVGNTLYFDKPYGRINILYKGLILDDNGLPEITDREANALATYCAYISKFKEGLMTNNANIIQMANVLKSQWNLQCDQAREDHYMSQNEWNDVLDVKTSWNRKSHGKSLKLYR